MLRSYVVVAAGLRERGHQAGQAAKTAVKRRAGPGQTGSVVVAGLVFANLPAFVVTSPSPAHGSQVAAFDAVLAAVALTGAVVLASGLAALPALVRFLRAGGWPRIRRRVAWAGGATAVAGGALAGLVLVSGSHSPAQLDASWVYVAGFLVPGTTMAVAIGLWAAAAAATARHLTLGPRVRAIQLVLGAVAGTLVIVVLATLNFWWSATQTPAWLIGGLVTLSLASVDAWRLIPRAVRKGRRLRAAASGRR